MDVFALRNTLIDDYSRYIGSFINIRNPEIERVVREEMVSGLLWPEPLIQLNPAFAPGSWIDSLVDRRVLHPICRQIFRKDKTPEDGVGRPLRLHTHQEQAITTARDGHNYVLTTGTGSGKSLAYIVPIVDAVLRRGSGHGIQAIIVYPMNALANSQAGELTKFLHYGFPEGHPPVTFARYTGQETEAERERIRANPPDILLTNYVMLELILTRTAERPLLESARGLRFLALDELHTYRGRQGADVALLIRRVRDRLGADQLQCVGTSATLAGPGTLAEQRVEVAGVATQLFGTGIAPEHVIGETLQPVTTPANVNDPAFITRLAARIANHDQAPPREFASFTSDPLSIWLEHTFGIAQGAATSQLVRQRPRAITGSDGAAAELSQLTGMPEANCAAAIRLGLLGGYTCEPHPETGFPPFAFRLHQFISRGDTVYASVEEPGSRTITVEGQQFVPGTRHKLLYPLVFCRECGQEYYCVQLAQNQAGTMRLLPRTFGEGAVDGAAEGYLYVSTENPWPANLVHAIEQARIPEDWLEEHRGTLRVRSTRRPDLPQPLHILPDGHQDDRGILTHLIGTPFQFCLNCGVTYGARQQSDFAKLSSLSSEGRSTATTILSLSVVRALRAQGDLATEARKLLSFTDNRQDAALQAGHLNDFVEIGVLRSALFRAVSDAGTAGIDHASLTQRVFDALALPIDTYAEFSAARPTLQARSDAGRALREVLGYRLYRDLERGWRITAPNLEQCGLLSIQYSILAEVCQPAYWNGCHDALVEASPTTREEICRVLLDYMRRELAIRVDYLDQRYQERIQQESSQHLKAPWALDENEQLEHAATLYPRSRQPGDYGGDVYLSARGGFGQYLRRPTTFPGYAERLRLTDTEQMIGDILRVLCEEAGIVVQVALGNPATGQVPGYQLLASSMRWVAGDGSRPYRDSIRVPRESQEGGRVNPFFVAFYREVASTLRGLEAREHTAQVPSPERQAREDAFRNATLPILYCSPTMELGVDIKQLNVVNMRNVPPTPANYAQRSGRAGRSGQPALVFTYCSTGSPHDQYFFRRPQDMVAGAVSTPRLDLANRDLIRSHVHAIWLAEAGVRLGSSLRDVLDLDDPEEQFPIQAWVRADVVDPEAVQRARVRAERVIATLGPELATSGWYGPDWLETVMGQLASRFDDTCERWRTLYRSALRQARAQDAIIRDASRSSGDKDQAMRLRREAEEQLRLLTEIDNLAQSDFYSYRYFASEGFLPGYSFPRLPLSAFIPARRSRQRDAFLSRPRFLAISEFGPRAIVYHEGSRYLINKVILPVGDAEPLTHEAKRCDQCGYLHRMQGNHADDRCERCGNELARTLRSLFRLQNVSTRRRDRISSDEEERTRLGYELITGVRFEEAGEDAAPARTATIVVGGQPWGRLTYGPTATLWRINLGWQRRRNRELHGFVLDTERGYWKPGEHETAGDPGDPLSPRTTRVVPYVEDHRNCLLLEPAIILNEVEMASLQTALKTAIQVVFQLEDAELAVEPLPDRGQRRLLLFYEAAEGGAGVLRRLVDDPAALASVAEAARDLCHFNADGTDRGRAPGARQDCEAACYSCLMTYANQRDHGLLDRKAILGTLQQLCQAEINASPGLRTRAQHRDELLRLAGSELERDWLRYLDTRGLRLPSHAQRLIETCATRPDFTYMDDMAAIYIDGPHHDYPGRAARDAQQEMCLENHGYLVVRFGHADDWDATLARFPYIFGSHR